MDRMTKRDENGYVECNLNIPLEFEQGCTGDCINCNADLMLGLLGWYEDEAERREKGCDYCKGVTKTGAIRLEDDFGRSLNYCPICGRKLVDKTND